MPQAEVQRVLAPLRGAGSGADEEETRCVLIFLTNASMNSTLRRVAVQQVRRRRRRRRCSKQCGGARVAAPAAAWFLLLAPAHQPRTIFPRVPGAALDAGVPADARGCAPPTSRMARGRSQHPERPGYGRTSVSPTLPCLPVLPACPPPARLPARPPPARLPV